MRPIRESRIDSEFLGHLDGQKPAPSDNWVDAILTASTVVVTGYLVITELLIFATALGRVDNSLVNLRRLGNQPGGILEPFVLVIILS